MILEDKIENAELGERIGLNAVLMEHDHNADYYNGNIPVVKKWKDIYDMIT